MRTNDERLRFLTRFRLSVTWSNDGASIYWRGQDSPGQPGGYHSLASAPTLEEAVDAIIDRWERKHGERWV